MTKIEQFKNTMYDYTNILEYYSFYGAVVYVSSSFYNDEDFFIVLRTPKEMAVVNVSATLAGRIKGRRNRDKLIADVEALESDIHWVVPTGFHLYVTGLISNPNFPDTNELIRLKNHDIVFWNKLFIEDALKKFKKNNSLLSRGMGYDQNVRNGYTSTFVLVDGLYDTPLNVVFESVAGNPFFDIKIRYHSGTQTRRLLYFDINELANLLRTVSARNEQVTLQAIANFVANA